MRHSDAMTHAHTTHARVNQESCHKKKPINFGSLLGGTPIRVAADCEISDQSSTEMLVALAPHNSRKLTDSQESDLIRRYLMGECVESIAEDFRLSRSGVFWMAKKHGVRRKSLSTVRRDTWMVEARSRYEKGEMCATIGAALGVAGKTVEQAAYDGGWLRLSAPCYRCGAPVSARSNRGNKRRCTSCRTAYLVERMRERRKQFGREYTGDELKRREAASERRSAAAARELARRQQPSVQMGRFISFGEQPITREGALAILRATLGRLLADRCEQSGISRDSLKYRNRYNKDATFREKERLRTSGKRWVNRSDGRDDGTLTKDVVRLLFARAKKCPYCWQPMQSRDKSLDHMEPLSLGGVHGISNVLVCCLRCNSRKHNTPYAEWLTKIPEPCERALRDKTR